MSNTSYKKFAVLLSAMSVFCACNEELGDPNLPAVEPVSAPVSFSGGVREKSSEALHGENGNGEEDVWLEMSYDKWQWERGSNGESVKEPIDFTIHQHITKKDNSTEDNVEIYGLKIGEKSRLECKNKENTLKWQSANARHVFHAWTEPEGVVVDNTRIQGTVDMTKRNPDYEYFVGATTDGMSYAGHGITVGLRFNHLIGKLCIDRATHIDSNGIPNADILWNIVSITFPNMPTSGFFTTGIEADSEMKVKPAEEAKGITYRLWGDDYRYNRQKEDGTYYYDFKPEFYVTNGKYTTLVIPFYVLPMQFGDKDCGKFIVTLYFPNTKTFKNYDGDLKDLVNEESPDESITGIRAGECLMMRLQLKDDKVDGFLVHINNWATSVPQDVKADPYPGIYTVDDMIRIAHQGDDGRFYLQPEDEMCEITADGKKIFKLYGNIDFGENDFVIVVPEPYILDGLGYNISGGSGLQIEGDVENLYVNGRKWNQ